jgi:hypothetical protein
MPRSPAAIFAAIIMTHPPHTTAPRPFVFVVMPFDPKLRDIYDLGIKPAAEMAGAYAERVDEQHYTGAILERVLNQINSAAAIVADMSGKNANVLYEVGYAHALGKSVVMITQDNFNDLPFDVNQFHHIRYMAEGGIQQLRTDLTPKITAAIMESVADRRAPIPCPLKLRIDGVDIAETGTTGPRSIPGRIAERGHNMIALSMTLCNVNSPKPFQVDGVFLLAQPHSSVARWAPHLYKGHPDWIHGPHDGYGDYTRRFKVLAERLSIPYFDGAHIQVPV